MAKSTSKSATKVASKSASPKPTLKKAAEKGTMSLKKLGSKLVLTPAKGAKPITRSPATDKDYDAISKKVELYNKQPKDTTKAAILAMMQPKQAAEKAHTEKVVAAKKGIKQQIKKATKTMKTKGDEAIIAPQRNLLEELDALLSSDPKAVDSLQALLNKYKKTEETKPEEIKPHAQASPVRRRGEY